MSTRRRKASPLAASPFTAPFTAAFTAPFTAPFKDPLTASLTAPLTAPFTAPFSAPFSAPLTAPLTAALTAPVTAPFQNLLTGPLAAVFSSPLLAPPFAPWASAPRGDIATIGQFLELQLKVWQMWIDSAQTIALRFLLAPPWMVASPWVRNEWLTMTAEKVAASHESMNAAVTAGLTAASFTPRALSRTAEGLLAPYSTRTRSNASRLGTRILNGEALSAALEPLAGKRKRRPAKSSAVAASPRRGRRRG